MVFLYIIGTFIVVMLLSWILGIAGIHILEGPDAGSWYFYGSTIIGILLSIHDKLEGRKNKK
ncbi:hypothetical protein [Paenibacillus massiliensis]|uniref:hypothetical protein n=1 Tax=Paenibacillus massiliensis TaxID=225917 RepID=UPI0003FB7768|nr:hypothetical protein [Paenibacillus massiliensis]